MMVRKLAFYVTCSISILLISSCGLNSHHSVTGQGSSIQITSPNNGVSFSTQESASVTIAGVCEKGVDVDLVTIPSRPVNNNCVTDGTWSFETGALLGGPNTFKISDGSITINVIAASMSIRADKTTIGPDGVANLQAIFFDASNSQIMIPAPTTRHHVTWSLVSGDADVESPDTLAAGEKAVVTAGASTGSIVVHAELDSIDSAYKYKGNTGYDITLTVATPTAPTSIPGVATSMTVTADKTTINVGDTAKLQVHFFDALGAEIVIPNATSSHNIQWSSHDPYVSFTSVTPPASNEKVIITGVAGGTTTVTAQLIGLDPSYGFPQANMTANISITVIGGQSTFTMVSHFTNAVAVAANAAATDAATAAAAADAAVTNTVAHFNFPYGVTFDEAGNLYVADTSNNTIRQIAISTGTVTTIAGAAGSAGYHDGTGAAAQFNSPQGITTDGTNLYVADFGNCTIRKVVISTGEVTTLAGSAGTWGYSDGTGANASFNEPIGITTDGTNLYVAEFGNRIIRRIVISTGEVTTIAGRAGTWGSNDGTGANASFSSLGGITTDGTNLYVADSNNNTIRQIVISTGAVTTIAGSAGTLGSQRRHWSCCKFLYPSRHNN